MIVLLAAMATLGPRIVEFPEPDSSTLSIQAVIRLSGVSGEEFAALQVAAESLNDGSQDYSASTLFELGIGGERLNATLSADHLQVRATVMKRNWLEGVKSFVSVLSNPRLDTDLVHDLIGRIPHRKKDYWEETIFPWKGNFGGLKPDDIRAIYQNLIRPESCTIGLAGDLRDGEVRTLLDSKLVEWNPTKIRRRQGPALEAITRHDQPVTTLEFRGQPVKEFYKDLAACIALGVGKGSIANQSLREERGISYRQEAVLSPLPTGLACRLIVVTSASPVKVRGFLEGSVKGLSARDLERVAGIVKALGGRGFEFTPFHLGGNQPLGSSSVDNLYLQSYWNAMFGTSLDWDKIGSSIRSLDVEELKNLCRTMIVESPAFIIPG